MCTTYACLQASQFEARDPTRTPPHVPSTKTLHYLTTLLNATNMKPFFNCKYRTSSFKSKVINLHVGRGLSAKKGY